MFEFESRNYFTKKATFSVAESSDVQMFFKKKFVTFPKNPQICRIS